MVNFDGFAFATIVCDSNIEQGVKFIKSLVEKNKWVKHVKVIYGTEVAVLSDENKAKLTEISPAVELTEAKNANYDKYISTGQASPSMLKLEIFNLEKLDKVVFIDPMSICVADMLGVFLNMYGTTTIREKDVLNLKSLKEIKHKKNKLSYCMLGIIKPQMTKKLYNNLTNYLSTCNCANSENFAIDYWLNGTYVNYASDMYCADSKYFPNGKNMKLPYKLVHYTYDPFGNEDLTFSEIDSIYTGKPAQKKEIKHKQTTLTRKPSPKPAQTNTTIAIDEFEKEYLAFLETLKAKRKNE